MGGPNGHPLPVVQPCLGDLIEHVTPYTLSPTNLIVRRSTLKVGGTRPRRRRTPRLEEGVEAFTKTTSTRKIVQVVVFVNGAYAPSALDARVCFGLVASPSRVDRLSGRKCHSKKTITRKFEILSLRACRAGSSLVPLSRWRRNPWTPPRRPGPNRRSSRAATLSPTFPSPAHRRQLEYNRSSISL